MNREALEKKFDKWKSDDSILKDYEAFTPVGNMVFIRLFYYRKEAPKGLILDTGKRDFTDELLLRVTPYAKVLKDYRVGDTCLCAGDIVTVADDVARVQTNPAFKEHMEMMKERPAPMESEIPPMYIGALAHPAWQQFLFIKDKLEPSMSEEDAHTFLVPVQYIKTVVNQKECNGGSKQD